MSFLTLLLRMPMVSSLKPHSLARILILWLPLCKFSLFQRKCDCQKSNANSNLVDHEHAPEYFTINVDGNKNLLAAAASVGTVKAYVYTSSGPIIAGSGGSYDHADETHPTLAVIRKGDPYQ
jgi:hypothetical protein